MTSSTDTRSFQTRERASWSDLCTCERKDGAVRPAAGQEVGHVAAAGVHEDGAGIQVVGHVGCAGAQLLAHAAVQLVCELRQHDLPMLLLPATTINTIKGWARPSSTCGPNQSVRPCHCPGQHDPVQCLHMCLEQDCSESGAYRHHSSMRVATARSTPMALSGYAPAALSPESMSASARCLTTSEMSATCQITPAL